MITPFDAVLFTGVISRQRRRQAIRNLQSHLRLRIFPPALRARNDRFLDLRPHTSEIPRTH